MLREGEVYCRTALDSHPTSIVFVVPFLVLRYNHLEQRTHSLRHLPVINLLAC